jgi:predicted amidohydrolase
MRIAVISNRNRPGYLDENLEDHLVWIDRAASAGASMVLFPELSLSGYSYQPFIAEMGIKLDDWRCKEIESKARSEEVNVAYGLPLVSRNKLYISHVLTGPKGLIGHYEKVHLAGPVYGEGRGFQTWQVVQGIRSGGCWGRNKHLL